MSNPKKFTPIEADESQRGNAVAGGGTNAVAGAELEDDTPDAIDGDDEAPPRSRRAAATPAKRNRSK